jgi:serine/threonine protein kinase
MTTDRIGQRLGNYTIIQPLGQGGFAEVYLGEHIYLKSQAAVKVLQARLSGSDDMDSFLKEAQTIAKLFHPHIIRIMDFGIEAETPYLVMDYAPKGTLRQKHPRGTPVPLPIIVPYVKQVADALQYAHNELRLIHRDIKPENMLIGRRDEILLSDFGIALVAQSSRYQGTQDVIGTVAYMAPEQIQGRPHAASDQYSLAVVVYEWLTGDRPFQGSFTEMCTQHIFASPAPLSTKAPSLPPDIDLVILQAMAKDPHQRFENIQAFADALEQVSLNRRGEQTEAMAPTFYSLLTEAQTNNPPALSRPPIWTPSSPINTPSQPMQNGLPGQSAQPGQFLSPLASTNLKDTALAGSNENAAAPSPAQPAPSWSQQSAYRPTLPAQPSQPKVVLPSPPASHYPAGNNAQLSPAPSPYGSGSAPQQNPFPPRPNNVQQANQNQFSSAYAPRPAQQQAMAPQRPAPDPAMGPRYGNNQQAAEAQSGFQGQPAPRQQEYADEGLGILAPLMRPTLATIVGIFLFCIANLFHPLILERPILLVLAVPLIFGAAFGPIVGLLVGLGGVFCLNLITPFPILPPGLDYLFVREHLISLHVIRSWWNPLFINGLTGALAGLSMLRKRRFPSIGSATRGTILGALALFGSIGFVFYSQFGLSVLLKSAFNIGIVGIANVVLAFALLVTYSILGRLLDPGA